jgi:hypothetical protein
MDRMTRPEVEGDGSAAKRSEADDTLAERTRRGDARCAIIGGCLTERSRERMTLLVRDRGPIEPVDAIQRRQHLRHRPLALGGVGDRHTGDLARRVIARKHAVPLASSSMDPSIAAAVVFRWKTRRCPAPPRASRVTAHCVELDEISERAFAMSGNAEAHARCAVEIGETEAALVELQTAECVGGATIVIAHLIACRAQ